MNEAPTGSGDEGGQRRWWRRLRFPALQLRNARLIGTTIISTLLIGALFVTQVSHDKDTGWSVGPGFRNLFDFLLENLPLTLPVLTVVLSVATRPHELRTRKGLLNLCNYFALGLVTFAIWAFVAAQSVPEYILVGQNTVLNKEYSLLLLLGAFTWASICAVVTALAEGSPEKEQNVWKHLQGALLAASSVLLFSPFFLFESKAEVEVKIGRSFDEIEYAVSISFQDPALDQHLGRSTDPLTQCLVQPAIAARSRAEAVHKALAFFWDSDVSKQFVPASRRADDQVDRAVQLIESRIVAEPRERGLSTIGSTR